MPFCVFQFDFQFHVVALSRSFSLLFIYFIWSFRSLAVGSNGVFLPVRTGCDAGSAVVVSAGPVQLSDYLRCRFGGAN